MPMGNPVPGVNSSVEYAVSTIPWVTSSVLPTAVLETRFPFVTQFVTVKNTTATSTPLYVAFTRNGLRDGHFIPLDPSGSFSADFRLVTVFLSGAVGAAYTMVAGLTGIPAQQYQNVLTGSGGFQGVG